MRTSKPGVGVLEFGSPVVAQLERGREYTFTDHMDDGTDVADLTRILKEMARA